MNEIYIETGAVVIGALFAGLLAHEWVRPKTVVVRKVGASHADKIKELADDAELSPDYIKDLVKNSHTKADLKKIANYIIDHAKTKNLSGRDIGTIKRMIRTKFDGMTEKEIMRNMIRTIKEKGTSMIDHITDYV